MAIENAFRNFMLGHDFGQEQADRRSRRNALAMYESDPQGARSELLRLGDLGTIDELSSMSTRDRLERERQNRAAAWNRRRQSTGAPISGVPGPAGAVAAGAPAPATPAPTPAPTPTSAPGASPPLAAGAPAAPGQTPPAAGVTPRQAAPEQQFDAAAELDKTIQGLANSGDSALMEQYQLAMSTGDVEAGLALLDAARAQYMQGLNYLGSRARSLLQIPDEAQRFQEAINLVRTDPMLRENAQQLEQQIAAVAQDGNLSASEIEDFQRSLLSVGDQIQMEIDERQREVEERRWQDERARGWAAVQAANEANRYDRSFDARLGALEAQRLVDQNARVDTYDLYLRNDVDRLEQIVNQHPEVFAALLEPDQEALLRNLTRSRTPADQQTLALVQEVNAIARRFTTEDLRGQTPVSNLDFLAGMRANASTSSAPEFVRSWVANARNDVENVRTRIQQQTDWMRQYGSLSAPNEAGMNFQQNLRASGASAAGAGGGGGGRPPPRRVGDVIIGENGRRISSSDGVHWDDEVGAAAPRPAPDQSAAPTPGVDVLGTIANTAADFFNPNAAVERRADERPTQYRRRLEQLIRSTNPSVRAAAQRRLREMDGG